MSFHLEVVEQKLWRCLRCGFIQVEQEPLPEILNAIYSEGYFTSSKYRGDSVALSRENERRIRLLKRWLSRGSEVLDAGCSTGDFVGYAKNDYQMYGLDYSSFAIDVAKRNNPELADKLQSGRIEEIEWADRSFDAICLWDVLEHIWEPVTVVKNLLLRVKPGGLVMISTPAIDSVMARICGCYWPFMTPPEHLSFFSLEAITSLVAILGNCEILYSRRRGKWANIAFIAYKAGRITPRWFPKSLLWPLSHWPLNMLSVYVPTGDILYLVLQKNRAKA
jgi:2-polyprenyl-3-methyl-5-hydroxy-6-metoxy-1,4-benzoquinol methylase